MISCSGRNSTLCLTFFMLFRGQTVIWLPRHNLFGLRSMRSSTHVLRWLRQPRGEQFLCIKLAVSLKRSSRCSSSDLHGVIVEGMPTYCSPLRVTAGQVIQEGMAC